MLIKDALLLRLGIQQVRDELLEGGFDPGRKGLSRRFRQTPREVAVVTQDDRAKLAVEVLVGPDGHKTG